MKTQVEEPLNVSQKPLNVFQKPLNVSQMPLECFLFQSGKVC